MLTNSVKIALIAVAFCAAVIVLVVAVHNKADSACNVAYIPMHGELVTYIPDSYDASSSNPQNLTASEDVTRSIRDAQNDPAMKAIVLEVDSPGGDPVAGQEIELALKQATKPTVALIRSQGDSAAYMAASGADQIFASEFSDVGSIGITESYTDQAAQNDASGITFNQLSIGKYKDMFDPNKPLTSQERAIALSELQVMYNDFVGLVADNRGLSTSTVLSLADGSTMTGTEAVQAGLVDQIGNIDAVRDYLTQQIGRNAIVCGIDTQ